MPAELKPVPHSALQFAKQNAAQNRFSAVFNKITNQAFDAFYAKSLGSPAFLGLQPWLRAD